MERAMGGEITVWWGPDDMVSALGFGTGAPGEGARAEVMREVREHFSPELLGRLDEVLVFGPLAQEDLVAIGETLLRELEEKGGKKE